MKWSICMIVALAGVCCGQQAGTRTQEYNPPLPMETCFGGACTVEPTFVVLDADGRDLYSAADSSVSCTSGGGFDATLCPDSLTCATNCAVDGIDQDGYNNVFGVSSTDDILRLNYVTESEFRTQIGSRLYLATDEGKYRMFQLKNRELVFDVDLSNLPCGINAALYFSEMEEDGGTASYPSNGAGAAYGTGYCDGQCIHYLRYSVGEVNIDGPTDFGICCIEMDILEANRHAHTYTTHSCTIDGYYVCNSDNECGDNDFYYDGVCDKTGCEFGPYRQNQHEFFGNDSTNTIDTSRPFSMATQFVTSDGTDAGDLVDIRRYYVQDGIVIPLPNSNFPETSAYDSITDDYCNAYKDLFLEYNDFRDKGSLLTMGDAMGRGMVLAISLWDDAGLHMQWLDGVSPPDGDVSQPGVLRGPCPADSGDPDEMHVEFPDAFVTFYNLKFGDIGAFLPKY